MEAVREDGDGRLRLHRPRRPRWLAFEPYHGGPWGWGRLLVVRPIGPLDAPPDPEGAEGVQGFSWGAAEGEEWTVQRDAVARATSTGPLHSIVYLARKAKVTAEWDHAFQLRPRLRIGSDGGWQIVGRVKVTERGIVS